MNEAAWMSHSLRATSRDPEQQRTGPHRTAACSDHAFVLFHARTPPIRSLVLLIGRVLYTQRSSSRPLRSVPLLEQEFGVADIVDLHPPHHLTDDDLDVLVVDVNALQPADLLDFVDEVAMQRLLAMPAGITGGRFCRSW